jgi:hypothetical protein
MGSKQVMLLDNMQNFAIQYDVPYNRQEASHSCLIPVVQHVSQLIIRGESVFTSSVIWAPSRPTTTAHDRSQTNMRFVQVG